MEVKPLKIRDEEHHSTVGQGGMNPWLHQDPERRHLKSPWPGDSEGPLGWGGSSQQNIHFSLRGKMGGGAWSLGWQAGPFHPLLTGS